MIGGFSRGNKEVIHICYFQLSFRGGMDFLDDVKYVWSVHVNAGYRKWRFRVDRLFFDRY